MRLKLCEGMNSNGSSLRNIKTEESKIEGQELALDQRCKSSSMFLHRQSNIQPSSFALITLNPDKNEVKDTMKCESAKIHSIQAMPDAFNPLKLGS
mgnify:FL=1